MKDKQLIAVQKEYIDALDYVTMYHSERCWKSEEKVDRESDLLKCKNANLRLLKERILIRVIVFG